MKKMMLMIVATMIAVIGACASPPQPQALATGTVSQASTNTISATGSYVGNGSAQTIGLPWAPGLVMIASSSTGAVSTKGGGLYFESMPSGAIFNYGSVRSATVKFVVSGGVQPGTSSFDVGSNAQINASGVTYYWAAVASGPWLMTGSYVGNGPTNNFNSQTINAGFDSTGSMLHIVRGNTTTSEWAFRYGDIANGSMEDYNSTTGTDTFVGAYLYTNSTGFQAFNQPNGTTVAQLNANGETYYYAALLPTYGTDTEQISSHVTTTSTGTVSVPTTPAPHTTLIFPSGSSTLPMTIAFDSMPAGSGLVLSFGRHASNDPAWTTNGGASGRGVTFSSSGFTLGGADNTGSTKYTFSSVTN